MTRRSVAMVAGREIRERARSKAFLASTLFTLLLLIAVIVVPTLLGRRPVTHQVGLLGFGNQPIIEAAEELIAPDPSEEDPRQVSIELTRLESEEEALLALEDGRVQAVLADGQRVLAEDPGGFGGNDVVQLLQRAASSVRVADLVEEQGTAAAEVIALLNSRPLQVQHLSGVDDEEQGQRALIAYGGLMLMYIAVLSYGFYTLTGVTEEKSNRVVEVLLASLRPWQLLAGKIIGIGVLGLTQFVITVAGALVAIELTGAIDLPAIPIDSALTLIGWFVLGYALYSVAFGAAGALVTRMEEAQNASAPLTVVALVGFFASFYVLDNPDTLVAEVFTYIPFTAPYVVPIRVALQAIPAWEVGLAVLVTLASIAALVRFAGRVYAGGLLQFSGRVKLRDAYRSAET